MKYSDYVDLTASKPIETSVTGIAKDDPQWVEKAAEKTEAVSGNDYVKLGRGVLTVNQIDAILKNLPLELTTCDSNNQYLYYNRRHKPEEMYAPRYPESIGQSLADTHPPHLDLDEPVSKLIFKMMNHEVPHAILRSPHQHKEDIYVLHVHHGLYEQDGQYVGTMEWIRDIKQFADYYAEQTGQKIVKDKEAEKSNEGIIDARSTASIKRKKEKENE